MNSLKKLSQPTIMLSRKDLMDVVQFFCETNARDRYTPAAGLNALRDSVCTAFAHIDIPQDQKESVNIFINALQDLYETVEDQDQNAEFFKIDSEDLRDIRANINCLRQVICIQHSDLRHHDVSSALLWAKTAIKKLIDKKFPQI